MKEREPVPQEEQDRNLERARLDSQLRLLVFNAKALSQLAVFLWPRVTRYHPSPAAIARAAALAKEVEDDVAQIRKLAGIAA